MQKWLVWGNPFYLHSYISAAESIGVSSTNFYAFRPKSYRIRWIYAAARAITPFKVIQGHRVWYQSKVINSNLAPILHHFRDIAFDRSKLAIFFTERSGIAKVPNGIETLWKISIACVGRTNVTHDRWQTDRRQMDGRRYIADNKEDGREKQNTDKTQAIFPATSKRYGVCKDVLKII